MQDQEESRSRLWLGLGILAVVALTLTSLGYNKVAEYQRHQAQERQDNAQQRRNEANIRLQRCFTVPPSGGPLDRSSCIAEAYRAVADAEHAQQDLKAQQDMAAWALAGLFITFASLAVTAISVILLWRTLKETARATFYYASDYIAANPPVIKAFQVYLDFQKIFEGADGGLGGVYLVNAGKSAARIGGSYDIEPHQYGSIFVHVGLHAPAKLPFVGAEKANPLRPPDGKIKAGGSFWWHITDASMVDIERLKSAYYGRSFNRIFVIGRVHFVDTRDDARQTVFCRVYDRESERFVEADIPDYEYQA